MGKFSQLGFSLGDVIVVLVVAVIVAAVAVPIVLKPWAAAAEGAAVTNVHTIVNAESDYATAHPAHGYAPTIAELAAATNTDPDHRPLIDAKLISGTKDGYRFDLRTSTTPGSAVVNEFVVTATPVDANKGMRTFCANQSGIVRQSVNGACDPANSVKLQ